MAQVLKPKTTFTLSQVQQKIWFIYNLEPEGVNDKLSFAAQIKAPVNREAIKKALPKLISRHDALRSKYYSRDGELIQEIQESVEVELEEIDAASWTWEELKDRVSRAAERRFNLEFSPVLRVSLFSRAANEHIILITVHHIASDRQSLLVLVDEFFALYQSEVTGTNTYLPPVKRSYRDYVLRESNILSSSAGDRLGKYWQQQLAGELPVLELPTYKPRPPIRTYNGSSYSFKLSKELTSRLRLLAEAENVSIYDTLLAAFQVILHRYTGEEDILIACDLASSSQQEFEKVVGNFDNPVVLRVPVAGSLAFKELVERSSKKIWENREYQGYPFYKLVEDLQSTSNFSHPPICQVYFSWHELQNLEWVSELETFELKRQKIESDFCLEVSELKETLMGRFYYNSHVLDAATVAQIAGHYQNLLSAIVENPNQAVAELPMLSESDRHQLLIDWNATEQHYHPSSIHELFEAQVERTPDAVAVVFEGTGEPQTYTYRELNSRANQLAHYLQKLGVQPEVLVGICVDRSLEMLVGLLGILKAGAAYVPLDPAYPQERLAYMIEDSQVRVLVTQQKFVAGLTSHGARVACIDADWEAIAHSSEENPVSGVKPENLAYTIYTSGSTGKPKGVQICHNSAVNFLNSMRVEPGLTQQDILLAVTTISFDIAALELYLPLIVGAKVVLVTRETAADGEQLLKKLIESGATVMQATPATWRLLLAAGWQSSSQQRNRSLRVERKRHLSLRVERSGTKQSQSSDFLPLKILCGGEALPADLANQLLERCAELWNVYGPTETTIWSTIYNVGANRQSARTLDAPELLGRPLANTQIYILDGGKT